MSRNVTLPNGCRATALTPPTDYDDATPERLARQMAERLRAQVKYAPLEAGGAARAAGLIAPLLNRA